MVKVGKQDTFKKYQLNIYKMKLNKQKFKIRKK